MKRELKWRRLLLLLPLLALLSLLPSCDDYDWDPVPPYGWNTFNDRNLQGCWILESVNGAPVSGYEVNYLEFYGNTRGMYYYYDNGYETSERIAYWCQPANAGYSRFQINIEYEYDSPATMNYWFTGGGSRLWMQWATGGGVVTYVYRPCAAPWAW